MPVVPQCQQNMLLIAPIISRNVFMYSVLNLGYPSYYMVSNVFTVLLLRWRNIFCSCTVYFLLFLRLSLQCRFWALPGVCLNLCDFFLGKFSSFNFENRTIVLYNRNMIVIFYRIANACFWFVVLCNLRFIYFSSTEEINSNMQDYCTCIPSFAENCRGPSGQSSFTPTTD